MIGTAQPATANTMDTPPAPLASRDSSTSMTSFSRRHMLLVVMFVSMLAALSLLAPKAHANLESWAVDNQYNKVFSYSNGYVARWEQNGKGYMRPIYSNINGYPNATVSEGTAYLMVLAALKGNYDDFIRNYNYWRLYTDRNAGRTYRSSDGQDLYKWLMPWLIDQYGTERSNIPAADADLDIAYALLVAGQRWGGSFNGDARNVIQAIKEQLIAPNLKIVLPWPLTWLPNEYGQYSYYITSYNMPGYYRIYGRATGDQNYWEDVVQKTYDWLEYKHLDANTGLNSYGAFDNGDFCNNRDECPRFEVDAMRLPLRIAQAYQWDRNDYRAKRIIDKVANWAKNKPTNDIRASYWTWGGEYDSYGSGAMRSILAYTVAESGQANWWANTVWDSVNNGHGGDFYQQAVTAMAMFAQDGRFYDPTSGGDTGNPDPVDEPDPVSGGTLDGNYRMQDGWNGFYAGVTTEDDWSSATTQNLVADYWSQQWEFIHLGNDVYNIRNRWSSDYLVVGDQNEWSEAKVAPLNPDWGSMRWELEAVDGNRYRLKNQWSGLYLNTAEGADQPLVQAPYNASWGSMIFTLTRQN